MINSIYKRHAGTSLCFRDDLILNCIYNNHIQNQIYNIPAPKEKKLKRNNFEMVAGKCSSEKKYIYKQKDINSTKMFLTRKKKSSGCFTHSHTNLVFL